MYYPYAGACINAVGILLYSISISEFRFYTTCNMRNFVNNTNNVRCMASF